MSKIKLQATDGNGGTISLKGPTTTDGNAEFELTLPANDGSANEYLKTNGSGVLSWATATPEGTSVKSTGESGGTKYLREDGDGTCSWQTVSAGTALTGSTNNTITTVTGANAIQGESNLTFDGNNLTVTSSGGVVSTDTNGFITSKQALDVATAGGALICQSNRGNLGRFFVGQKTTSADGGYATIDTCASGSTSLTERLRIEQDGKWYKNTKQIFLPLQYFEVNVTGSTNFNTTSSWPDTKQLVTGFSPVKGGSRLWVHSTLQTWWGATSNSSSTDVYARIMATNTDQGSGYNQVWKNSRYAGNFAHNQYYTHDSKHAIFSCVTASDGADMDFKFQAYMGSTLSNDFNLCHTNEYNLVQIWEYDIT